MQQFIHVLLTGGVGSRLWPLSRQSRPKQYLQLFSNFSLFELAVQRNSAFSNGLVVVGNQQNNSLSEASLKKLEITDYTNIVETTPRNTAPAIAFAAFAVAPESVLLITPADHIIKEGEEYDIAVKRAIELANDGSIVTFGISPSKPETGYGYIEHDKENVISFREKPNKEDACEFIESGNFLWNSGMFCVKAGIFQEELKKYAPEVYAKSYEAWKESKNGVLDLQASLKIPSISIDYALMENSDKIKVVKSNFEWSDMGSFEAVYDHLKENGQPIDEYGNMVIGSEKFTAFVGMENSILVCTEDANLVLMKEDSQKVKDVYQTLEKSESPLIK
ncbi:mannose-1-phosphate guanylyltransferase [Gillisia sp. JM1]|uniref:mannose-1-phosphate guanylyltransferase n=1 Tax=Gillisia sp. JM1 TaxID=1283286 RepID=UPI00047CC1DA|nr:mannose-1-phosphate guanylyltransferase [Gillisia sp. JM1]